ncbi:MAG: NADPH-dependent 7-cyano-7-deazaguanine reductase QueF [Woeseia sp.]
MRGESLLGEKTDYTMTYSPDLLRSIPRADSRRTIGLTSELPFRGEDVWNAYELSWLNDKGKPQVATGEFRVPADSPTIIESKSMKLYLVSLSMTRYGEPDAVAQTIITDLSRAAAGPVSVELCSLAETKDIVDPPGICIDDLDVECSSAGVDPGLLGHIQGDAVSEALHSHILRTLCPVTGQPDSASILIRYHGRQLDRAALLRYLVSYRHHADFHENCVERIFVDIKNRCEPAELTVYARYNRRGGLDINPFRSDFESGADNIRLWRQ